LKICHFFQVVLADGTVLDLLKRLRKDNTGYDLKQLFIGAEGTLGVHDFLRRLLQPWPAIPAEDVNCSITCCAGVVTKVAIKCVPSSHAVHTLLMCVPSFDAVQRIFSLANKHLAEVLSAFEFFDKESMKLALQHVHAAQNPFDHMANMYVLVETSGMQL
jgi:FAD/FMN-containing dehydrogenase